MVEVQVQVTISLDLYHIKFNYMAITTIMQIRSAGVQYMRDHPQRFVESNTENS